MRDGKTELMRAQRAVARFILAKDVRVSLSVVRTHAGFRNTATQPRGARYYNMR